MRMMYQYQPGGGSPARERDVFWLTPKNDEQRQTLKTFVKFLRAKGVKAGWTGLGEEMVIIEFPKA
jgi:hypothetical protein